MARLPGFVGGTYQSQSVNADAQRCMNLYPEAIESKAGKNVAALYRIPGLTQFASMPYGPNRGCFCQDGRAFFVGGPRLYEIGSDASVTERGTVLVDQNPATFASSGIAGHQLFITSGGHGYIFDLVSSAFSDVLTGCTFGGYVSGYFVALDTPTATLKVSNLLDGTTWDAADVAQRSARGDKWQSMFISHGLIWLFGSETFDIWAPNGSGLFPFDPVAGAYGEFGCVTGFSAARFDNSLIWLARNDQGNGLVMRGNGYSPERISTHAIEYAFSTYSTIEDGIAYTYQDQGHTFYVLTFPTANATWVYDAASGLWHERGFWNVNAMQFDAYRPGFHCYAYGRHLVGDRLTGQIYEMTHDSHLDADGAYLRWLRRCPHLCSEQTFLLHHRLQVDLEVGLGLLTGQGVTPLAELRWSNDGGHAWSPPVPASMGPRGEYRVRCIWRRLGWARDRVYEVSGSDPIPTRLIDAYLDVQGAA
jgi:hypothetical protein